MANILNDTQPLKSAKTVEVLERLGDSLRQMQGADKDLDFREEIEAVEIATGVMTLFTTLEDDALVISKNGFKIIKKEIGNEYLWT